MYPMKRQAGGVGLEWGIPTSFCRGCAGRSDKLAGRAGGSKSRLIGLRAALPQEIFYSSTTLLVTRGKAFYNPSNTALEAVVSLIRHPGAQSPKRTVAHTASGCLTLISILEFPRSTE